MQVVCFFSFLFWPDSVLVKKSKNWDCSRNKLLCPKTCIFLSLYFYFFYFTKQMLSKRGPSFSQWARCHTNSWNGVGQYDTNHTTTSNIRNRASTFNSSAHFLRLWKEHILCCDMPRNLIKIAPQYCHGMKMTGAACKQFSLVLGK